MPIPAVLYLVVTLFCFPSLFECLTCNYGTNAWSSLGSCDTDSTAGEDACLTALFRTPRDSEATWVHFCGNCNDISNATKFPQLSNVSCCYTDACGSTYSLPNSSNCDAILDQTSCTNRSDCYWCGNSIFGYDLCKAYNQTTTPLCFTVPLSVPPPVCGSVTCEPIVPAYSVDNLTLSFLTAYGLPPVPAGSARIFTALDLLSRTDLVTMNETSIKYFCQTNQLLLEWCNYSSVNPLKYCVVTEQWPQYDVMGWLANTTFAPGSTTPFWPAICPCNYPGRAIYIPYRQLSVAIQYNDPCDREEALLAFYILLIVAYFACFLVAIYDTIVLGVILYQKKGGLALSKTLPVKIIILIWFVVSLVALIVFTQPAVGSKRVPLLNGSSVLKLLATILLLLCFCLCVFAFIQILIEARVFGTSAQSRAITIFKWTFLTFCSLILFSLLPLIGVGSYYTEQVVGLASPTLAGFVDDLHNFAKIAQTILFTLIAMEFVMIIVTGTLLAIVTYMFTSFSGSTTRGMRDLLARDLGLMFCVLLAIPHLSMLIMISIIFTIVNVGELTTFIHPQTSYNTLYALYWFEWSEYFCQLLWICSMSYAMRTVVKKNFVLNTFQSVLGIDILSNLSAGRSGKSGASFDTNNDMSIAADKD